MNHQTNLSINSIQSLIEPLTPPDSYSNSISPWNDDSNNHYDVNNDLNLPSFNLDSSISRLNQSVNMNIVNTTSSANTATNISSLNQINFSNNRSCSLPLPTANQSNQSNQMRSLSYSNTNNITNSISNLSLNANKTNPSTSQNTSTSQNPSPTPNPAPTNSNQPSTSIASISIGNQKIDKDLLNYLNKVPLSSLKSEILKLSKDQFGCRFLQKKIEENDNNFEIVFQEIYLNIYELIIDPFGNYLIQKLISYCSELQLNLLIKNLSSNLFQISINQHGTRALQKIIEFLRNNYQINLIIAGLKSFIIDLIKDLNGNHVITKILNKFSPENCQFIYNSICSDIITVSTHKHGCCVLQKCLIHVTNQQLLQISNEIIKNCNVLIKNQFGNYVIQYLLSLNDFSINLKIFKQIEHNLNDLIIQKFASNVIEKFLKNCYDFEKSELEKYKIKKNLGNVENDDIIDEMRNEKNYDNDENSITTFSKLKQILIFKILTLDLNKFINDPYGNYVIQTLIDVLLSQKEQVLIIKNWFKNCKILSSFGKRIQSKINSILNGNSSLNLASNAIQSSNSSSISPPNQLAMSNQNQMVNMNSNGEFISRNSSVNFQVDSIPGSNSTMNSFNNSMSNISTNISTPNFIRSNDYFSQQPNMPLPNYNIVPMNSKPASGSSSSSLLPPLNQQQSQQGAPQLPQQYFKLNEGFNYLPPPPPPLSQLSQQLPYASDKLNNFQISNGLPPTSRNFGNSNISLNYVNNSNSFLLNQNYNYGYQY